MTVSAWFIVADTTGSKSRLSLEDKVLVWPSAPRYPQSVSLENIFHSLLFLSRPCFPSVFMAQSPHLTAARSLVIYSLLTHWEDGETNNERWLWTFLSNQVEDHTKEPSTSWQCHWPTVTTEIITHKSNDKLPETERNQAAMQQHNICPMDKYHRYSCSPEDDGLCEDQESLFSAIIKPKLVTQD